MRHIYSTKFTLFFVFIILSNIVFVGCEEEKEIDPILYEMSNNISMDSETLTFYMPGTEKRDSKEVLDTVAEKSDLNIMLDFKWVSLDNYTSTVKTALASGEEIDAFICGNPESGYLSFVNLFRNGEIKDITNLLPQYAPVILGQLSQYRELECIKLDGKIVAIPSMMPQAKLLCLSVRQDFIEKYSISQIDTYDNYEKFMAIIKNYEKDIVPSTIGAYNLNLFAGVYDYTVLNYSLNLVYKNDDPLMQIIPWEQTPEYKTTISLVSKWYKSGYLNQGEVNYDELASFLYLSSNFLEGTISIDINQDGKKVEYTNYILYKDKKIQRESPIGGIFINGAVAFNVKSEKTERVLMFLNWIQSNQENYDLFMYGIKDKDYFLKEGRVAMPEGVTTSKSPYLGWLNNAFLNLSLQRVPSTYSIPDNFYDIYLEIINSQTVYAPHEGFFPDYSTIQNECYIRNNIFREKIIKALSNGIYDINQTDNIIEDLKSAGTDKIILEIQRQLGKWKKTNYDYSK